MGSNQPIISIIIPAHNCEKTIEQAVDSIFNGLPTIKRPKIEVLIIENGSNDRTKERLAKLKDKYQEVRLFTSLPGVSKARNKGIQESKGKYLAFLDADDFYLNGAIGRLLNDIHSQKPDLLVYSYESGDVQRSLFKQDQSFISEEKREGLISLMLKNPTNYLTVWGKAFKASIIKQNDNYFDEELSFSEDSLFVLQYLSVSQTIIGFDFKLYHYAREANSAVRMFNTKKIGGYIQALVKVGEEPVIQNPIQRESYYIYGLMQLNLIGVHGIFSRGNSQTWRQKVKTLKNTLAVPVLQECLKETSFSQLKRPKFIAIILIKLRLYSLAGIVFTLRDRLS